MTSQNQTEPQQEELGVKFTEWDFSVDGKTEVFHLNAGGQSFILVSPVRDEEGNVGFDIHLSALSAEESIEVFELLAQAARQAAEQYRWTMTTEGVDLTASLNKMERDS